MIEMSDSDEAREYTGSLLTRPLTFYDLCKSLLKSRILTAHEASKYILGFTYFEIPVVNFVKVCYQGLSRIAPYDETALVNFLIEKLKDKLALNVQINQLTKITEFTMLIKQTFFPFINPLDCMREIEEIHMKEGEDIFDYIARFHELHAIILDHKISVSPDCNIADIIKTVECEHLNYLLNGIPSFIARRLLDDFCTISSDLNFYLIELILQIRFLDLPKKGLAILKEQNPQLKLQKVLTLSIHAATCNVIQGFELDEQTSEMRQLTAKQASKIIPYFNGYEPSIYDFIESCYIALSNISIQEKHKLTGIIISRLKGQAAKCIKWIIMTNVHDLIKILMIYFKYEHDQYVTVKLHNIYMLPEDSIYDYIKRFKKMHIISLNQEINANSNQNIKEIIRMIETRNLVEFIKGFSPKYFEPNFLCTGFHDFLEKVVGEYNIFKSRSSDDDKDIAEVLKCSECSETSHMRSNCKITQRIPYLISSYIYTRDPDLLSIYH